MPIIALDFQFFFRLLLPLEIALEWMGFFRNSLPISDPQVTACCAEPSLGNASLQLAIQKNVP